MTNQTRATAALVDANTADRTLAQKLGDVISCLDYGATVAGTAAANTTAINNALAAAAASGANGFVLVPYGVSYTESSLSFTDEVQLIVFGQYGTVTFLSGDQGSSAIARGGISLKSKGATGVLLRSHDAGVTADPFLQVVDATNGDVAAAQLKYAELPEITAPTTPTADKVRLYAAVNGSVSELYAKFQDGSVVPFAKEGQSANLVGSTTWDPGSIAANAKESKEITVTGATLGDFCIVAFSLDVLDLTLTGNVTASNIVTAVLHNNSVGAVDLGSGTISALVFKRY
jgi:hypothetical protein